MALPCHTAVGVCQLGWARWDPVCAWEGMGHGKPRRAVSGRAIRVTVGAGEHPGELAPCYSGGHMASFGQGLMLGDLHCPGFLVCSPRPPKLQDPGTPSALSHWKGRCTAACGEGLWGLGGRVRLPGAPRGEGCRGCRLLPAWEQFPHCPTTTLGPFLCRAWPWCWPDGGPGAQTRKSPRARRAKDTRESIFIVCPVETKQGPPPPPWGFPVGTG